MVINFLFRLIKGNFDFELNKEKKIPDFEKQQKNSAPKKDKDHKDAAEFEKKDSDLKKEKKMPEDIYDTDNAVSLSNIINNREEEELTKSKINEHLEVKKIKEEKNKFNLFKEDDFQEDIRRGIIMKEILSKPRSKNPYKLFRK
ncbi:MAG: hypothetical protein ACOCQ2_00320 [Halanaerobiales bacterium]